MLASEASGRPESRQGLCMEEYKIYYVDVLVKFRFYKPEDVKKNQA